MIIFPQKSLLHTSIMSVD